jgi:uncharacterized caspase-like protein
MAQLHRKWLVLVVMPLCMLLATRAHAGDRVALLIGNNNYSSTPLRNAANDAKDLSETLKELGFKVIERENVSRKEMIDAIREFGVALEGAQAALFFYAGHAMQFKDRNYLVPIDATMGSEEDVTFFSVEIAQVFDRMEKAKTQYNFIILDACRDNPFAGSFRLSSAGLAQINAPSGTLIAYATSPGSVAADGFGRNGIYTKHILQNIKAPDLPVEIMFKRVREGVERETRRSQTPWDSSSLKGDFAFNSTSSGRAAGAAPASATSSDAGVNIELEFWSSVKDSSIAEDIRAYLDKYPNGNFAALAKNRLEALQRPARAPAAPAAPEPARPPAVAAAPAGTAPAATATTTVALAERSRTIAPARDPPTTVALAAPAADKIPPPQPVAPAPPKPPERLLGREIAPGVREITYPDGSIYRGAVKGQNLHGRGEYIAKTWKYEGEFNEGLKEGEGTYTWENGDRYAGHFTADRPDVKGKYVFANGDAYEGDVQSGIIVGRGTYLKQNGDVFEGSFVDGKPQGVGIYRFATGDRYEGEMAAGNLQGKGRYFSKSGDRVEASFVDGKPQGKGVYFFANKDRYEGDIQAGALTGQGSYFYASGLKYEGGVRLGRPEGQGIFWFLDGLRFEGQFENGLAHAKGELIKPDGTRTPAEIIDGNARSLN